MGGLMSRNKGKRGERDVVDLLQKVVDEEYLRCGRLPIVIRRNLMQSYKQREGFDNHDLVGLDWLALEVKRQEKLNVDAWWEQACEQAGVGKTPVLFYRQNNKAWRVVMHGVLLGEQYRVKATVEVDVDTFLCYFAMRLREKLGYYEGTVQTQ